MSKISIIVPIFNVEKYLLGCLKSVASQTFKDFECICVDDGSTDNSGKIADDFSKTDERFSVIHQVNGGLSDARNTGMKNSSSDYVFFLDSDDYIHPKTLETLYNIATEKQTEIVNCSVKNTSELFDGKLEDINITNCKIETINNPLRAFLTRRDIKTGVCFRLYKRSKIEHIPFIKGIYFEDIPFTTQLMNETEKIIYIDAPFYYYYKNPNSMMRSNFTTDKIDSYDKIIHFLANYFKDAPKEKRDFIQKYLFNQRIKMILNQCIRKEKDKKKQLFLFEHAQPILKNLFNENLISYRGLKLKHKITLYLLLNKKASTALKWGRLF